MSITKDAKKILIIGNAAAGKTRLAQALSKKLGIEVLHVDSIQYNPDLSIRPIQDTLSIIDRVMKNASWIIDGYGPLDNLIERFMVSDIIIFIDLPLRVHLWWALKRQFFNIFKGSRNELPLGAKERSLSHTKKLLNYIIKVNTQMRPEVIRILSLSKYNGKVVYIKSKYELRNFVHTNISDSI